MGATLAAAAAAAPLRMSSCGGQLGICGTGTAAAPITAMAASGAGDRGVLFLRAWWYLAIDVKGVGVRALEQLRIAGMMTTSFECICRLGEQMMNRS